MYIFQRAHLHRWTSSLCLPRGKVYFLRKHQEPPLYTTYLDVQEHLFVPDTQFQVA